MIENPELRMQPVTIGCMGSPGNGKSVFAVRLAKHLLPKPLFSYNALDERWDGSENCNTILMDEFMPIRQGDSPDIVNFIKLISSVPFRPNFGEQELKGDLLYPQFVVITTNQDINCLNTPYFTHAIRRRFDILIDFDRRQMSYKENIIQFTEQNFLKLLCECLRTHLQIFNELLVY